MVLKKNAKNIMDGEEDKRRGIERGRHKKNAAEQHQKKTSKVFWSCYEERWTRTPGNNWQIGWEEKPRTPKKLSYLME